MMVEQYVMNVVKRISKMNKVFIILSMVVSLSSCQTTYDFDYKNTKHLFMIVVPPLIGGLIGAQIN